MLFGSSGIRRTYDDTFPLLSMRVGAAAARLAGSGNSIVLGHDSRKTGSLLCEAFASGCLSNNVSVAYAGLVPTPTVAYAGKDHAASCMITASHNPEPDNGIKLFTKDGSSISTDSQHQIEALLTEWSEENSEENNRYGTWKEQATKYEIDAVTMHMERILHLCPDVAENIPLILDCGNGAGCSISPALLTKAGAHLHTINAQPNYLFARPSEPLESNLPYIPNLIKATQAQAALIHDGDADRLMAFDDRGRYIPGDQLLLLFAKYLDAKQIVTTYDASMVLEEHMEVRRTPVGDAHVSQELRKGGTLGGEPSGAWIFPELSYCPDGPHAACLLAEIASETKLSKEIDAIPRYPLLRESFHIKHHHEIMLSLGAASSTDGIRFETEDGWCLIRASGTEPKIRITAEGRDMKTAKDLLAQGHERIASAKYAVIHQ